MPLRVLSVERRSLGLYLAAWLPFAAAYSAAVRLSGAATTDALLSGLTSVGAAALLGLVFRRLMPDRGTGLWSATGRHVVLGVLYAACWTAVVVAQIRFGAPRETYEGFLATAVTWQFVSGFILYGMLAAAFTVVDTARRLREQEARAIRAEALHAQAELSALRSQLNPHFLFNTLHTITALVRSDADLAESALERLGGLLRRVLAVGRDSGEEIALADELEFVRDYLALERIRLGDRLRVVEEIDEDALDCSVLAFTLQPLVENAVRHAVAPLARHVTVGIAASSTGDRLVLEVSDDGPGATAHTPQAGSGVGLAAVRQRLEARFGRDAAMTVISAPGEGFRVRLEQPALAPRRPSLVAS